jgi:hypothetical protein
MVKLIYFFYMVVAVVCSMLITTTLVDEPQTKLPCREVGNECRRW